MRGHQMLDQVQSPSGTSPLLPKQRCTKHGGKVIDVYCPGHDTVSCSTCIAVEHSGCKGISFIPDIAKNIGTSSELQQFESKMSSLESRCILLSQTKDSDTQTLKWDMINILGEIKDFRKKVNDHLQKMENKLTSEADTKFKLKMKNVEDDKTEIQDILEDLRKTEQRLQDAKTENESELFLLLKSERANLEKIFAKIDKMECAGTTFGLKLTVEERIEKFMNEGCGIGEVDELNETIIPLLHGEYDTKAEEDTDVCGIVGICLGQGHMYLIDYNNKTLKKLDNHYKLKSYLTMNSTPTGVCSVDDKRLAVTLMFEKKVQFVSCTEPMQLLSSFPVGDGCRGIEYNNGLLFVCCGGDDKHKEGPGHIEIYNIRGTLMSFFFNMTGIPRSLSVSPDGSYVYVTYWGEGRITIFGSYGEIVQECKYPKVKGGSRICRLNANYSADSHNIAVSTNDGQIQQIILTEKDKIKLPIAICFDKKYSRLLVCSYASDKIKVFQLNI